MSRQVALPCLLLAAPRRQRGPGAEAAHAESGPSAGLSQLDLRGGTDTAMAPPVGYMEAILLPTLRQRLGVDVSLRVRMPRSPCGVPMRQRGQHHAVFLLCFLTAPTIPWPAASTPETKSISAAVRVLCL